MQRKENCEIDVKTLAPEIVRRCIQKSEDSIQEKSLLAKIEKVYESKKKYLAHLKKDLALLESEYEDLQLERINKEKHFHSLIENNMHPGLRVKTRLMEQLQSLETEEIEDVMESEQKFEHLTKSFLDLLENHTQEKQHKAVQELTAEIDRLKNKSQEYDDIISLLRSKYGLVVKSSTVGHEFHCIPGSFAAKEEVMTITLKAIKKSLEAKSERLNTALDSNLEERLAVLEAELKSLQNHGHFNGELTDILN